MPAGDGAASGSREARGRGALPLAVAAGWVGVGVAWGERWRVGGEVSVREVHSQAACLCGYGFIVVATVDGETQREPERSFVATRPLFRKAFSRLRLSSWA